jgi:hypothetical protein
MEPECSLPWGFSIIGGKSGLWSDFYADGRYEADMAEIKAYYAGVTGKYAHLTSEKSIR